MRCNTHNHAQGKGSALARGRLTPISSDGELAEDGNDASECSQRGSGCRRSSPRRWRGRSFRGAVMACVGVGARWLCLATRSGCSMVEVEGLCVGEKEGRL